MTNQYIEYTTPDHSIWIYDYLTFNTSPYAATETHSHHEEYEIYWFLEGDLFFSFEGQKFPVEPGDMILISNRQLHRPIITNLCTYHRKRIVYSGEIFDNLGKNNFFLRNMLQNCRIIQIHKTEVEKEQLDRIFTEIQEAVSSGTLYEQFCAQTAILYFLIRASAVSENRADQQPDSYVGKAYDIVQYIDSHIADDLSYKKLSAEFFISEKNLYNFFKKETGFSLGKYITERRIIKVKTILNAGGSISDAMNASGFSDYSVFYRNFVKITGTAPSEYIKKMHRPDELKEP